MAKEIFMPALSPTMQKGNLVKWLKREGETVMAGDVIAEIETDKSTMELEAPFDGIIHKHVLPEGTKDVAINTCIGWIRDADEAPETAIPAPTPAPTPGVERSDSQTTMSTASTPAIPSADAKTESRSGIKVSPVARKIAAEKHLNLQTIQGTGPHGRIIKRDVMQTSVPSASDALASSTSQVEQIPVSNMRHVIASRLSESKQTIPHFYLEMDYHVDALLSLRQAINAQAQDGRGTKITLNDMIVKAMALSVKEVPEINTSWKDSHIERYPEVNICVAVAIPEGLVTPVIRHVDQKSVSQISSEIKALATKAQKGKIMPEDLQGGYITISNLGMYKIPKFSAIINPPQSCILAVGSAQKRPLVKDDQVIVASLMSVVLSLDHRVIDGAVGSRFLLALKSYLEEPIRILVA